MSVIVVNGEYIDSPSRCKLTDVATKNLDKVHIVSIDSYPSNRKYINHIRSNIMVPEDSGIEERFCNSHSDDTMNGALGIKLSGKIPSLVGAKVTFVPGILCTGAAYEPYLIASLKKVLCIARRNAVLGIKTVVIYSIGGTYNTKEKIETMKKITEIEDTYVVASVGNDKYRQYDNCELNFFKGIPKLIIVGGTQNGNQLLNISLVGKCVRYYAPGKYKSAVTGKMISGTSFSGPIVAYLITNYLLNNIDASREDVFKFLDSKTDNVQRKTRYEEQTVDMKIFRRKGSCKFKNI